LLLWPPWLRHGGPVDVFSQSEAQSIPPDVDVILGNIQQRAEQAIAATEVLEPYQGVKQSASPIGRSDGGELDGQHNGLQAVGCALCLPS